MVIAEIGTTFATGLAAALLLLTLVFVIARRLRRYDLIDSAWGLSFIVIALTSLAQHRSTATIYELTVTGLVLVWGLRLSWHIFRRFRRSSKQDKRYTLLSQPWRGNLATNMYLRVYLVQALLASIVTLPIIVIDSSHFYPQPVVFTLGVLVWLFGFLFEAVADQQLKQFVAQPNSKGKLLQDGLWGYSRHPNYFGEITLWWGFALMSLSLPFGWLGAIGASTITFLIVRVSGLPPSEKQMSKRIGWTEYKNSTSPLIPWIKH